MAIKEQFRNIPYFVAWDKTLCKVKKIIQSESLSESAAENIFKLWKELYLSLFVNEMLLWSIHWVACGTCYRKSEGTELCGIEIQHSSLWRTTNKGEARNIGFWADMLIIFKFPHNFCLPQVCPLSIWRLSNTRVSLKLSPAGRG